MYTSVQFHNLINGLVKSYVDGKKENPKSSECILEFLDSELCCEDLQRINHLDLIREIHMCNSNGCIFKYQKSSKREFSARFLILLGICEEIEFINRHFDANYSGEINYDVYKDF